MARGISSHVMVVIAALIGSADLMAQCETTSSEHSLVEVGEADVTIHDFERTYVASLIATGENDTRGSRYRHLENLVDAELLYREAERRGLGKDDVSVRFRDRAYKKAVGGRFYEVAFLETLEPLEDAEIRRAFALSKEKAVVRHLYYTDSLEARAAWLRLQSGVSFLEEAARNYGLSEIDSSAGYLGPIKYFMVDDAFAEAAFGLSGSGEYTEPVRSRVGYHIIYLDDRILNPLLTESEYQTKKKGIASQVRLRKRRMEGDRFVRSFMAGLDVVVNAEAIEALSAELELLESSAVPDEPSLTSLDELPLSTGSDVTLRPDTPLARYTLNGETRMFTAEQYGFWLPELPFSEARHRTAASVGRALRNEVFADEGERRGLAADEKVEDEVDYQMRIHLSRRLRAEIHTEGGSNPTPEDVGEVLDQLGIDTTSVDVGEKTRQAIASMAAERRLLDRLRADTSIQLDSLCFEAIARLE